ncbi:hypothetical protein SAMN02745823_03754, partial [Sporobacter termitidis DSM 10068]
MSRICKYPGCTEPTSTEFNHSCYCATHRSIARREAQNRRNQVRQNNRAAQTGSVPTSYDFLKKFKPYIDETKRTGLSYG